MRNNVRFYIIFLKKTLVARSTKDDAPRYMLPSISSLPTTPFSCVFPLGFGAISQCFWGGAKWKIYLPLVWGTIVSLSPRLLSAAWFGWWGISNFWFRISSWFWVAPFIGLSLRREVSTTTIEIFWLAYLSFFRLLNAHAGGQLWFWLFQTTS